MAFYSRFIVTFADEEVKIALIKNNKIKSSIKGNLNEIKELDKFFAQAMNSRIIILIKNREREEFIKSYKGFSYKDSLSQAKDFLKSQYNDDKFTALEHKDNQYTYYNINITSFMRGWLDYIMSLNNRIHSIYTVLDLSKEVDILNICSQNKNLLKIYNPSISPIIFSELLNFYLGNILKFEAVFIVIIFLILCKLY